MLERRGVRARYVIQCKGDAVYIPSGAVHQVLNINGCIKAACDFISPQDWTTKFRKNNENQTKKSKKNCRKF